MVYFKPNAVPLAGAGAVVRTGTESDALTMGALGREGSGSCDGCAGCEALAACCVAGAPVDAFFAICLGGCLAAGDLAEEAGVLAL